LALIRLEQGMPSGESSIDAGGLGASSGSDLTVGGSSGLLAIGEVGDLHMIGSNGLRMGGDDSDLRGSGSGALRVIGGGLRVIGSAGALTVNGRSSALSADDSSGHRAKGLVLVPRSWVQFGSLHPIIGDWG
jgi:hypothetical protein